MTKIGIATITSTKVGAYNYGNILQNYALTRYIQDQGFDVDTIYYQSVVPEYTKSQNHNKPSRKTLIQTVDDVIRVIKRKINKGILEELKKKRDDGFQQFIEEYITYSANEYCASSEFQPLNELYDGFVVGSDQVWNPYYEGSNEFFYLGFADRHKRIAYAPSIGVGTIPNQIEKKMGKWLQNFDNLSIRECDGQQLLLDHYSLESELVCDPVFLLSRDEWRKIISPSERNEKYFAVYILGKKSVETKKKIRKLEKKYRIKAIDLYTRDDANSSFCGPAEFLGTIASSQFVVTDSFHGTAFSILFGLPVVIVDRNAANKKSKYKMSGRIENILSLAELGNRDIDAVLGDEVPLNLYVANVENTKLGVLISSSKKFLDKQLGRLIQ